MNLQPGDKVSFINDKLNGVVKYRIDKKKVMVELEDGFDVPVDAGELVIVEKYNKDVPGEPSAAVSELRESELPEELFLAFSVQQSKYSGNQVHVYVLNNTPFHIYGMLLSTLSKEAEKLFKIDIAPYTTSKITTFQLDDIEEQRNWQIQALHFNNSMNKLPAPVNNEIKIKPANLLKAETLIPATGHTGWLSAIPLKGEAPVTIQTNPVKEEEERHDTSAVVDLHAGKLVKIDLNNNTGILHTQMLRFRTELEKAIAANMEKITFIHGVGNGVLKKKIAEALQNNKDVARFEEGDHKKYGYGATTVYLKSV